MDVFQEPKGLKHKREVEHEIQLLLNSPLPNIGLYKIIEEDIRQGVVRSSISPCGSLMSPSISSRMFQRPRLST